MNEPVTAEPVDSVEISEFRGKLWQEDKLVIEGQIEVGDDGICRIGAYSVGDRRYSLTVVRAKRDDADERADMLNAARREEILKGIGSAAFSRI